MRPEEAHVKPILIAAAASLAFVAVAGADTRSDGSVSVQPGMWNWKQETHVIGIPIKETNLECLIPEKATITLSELARDLDEGCWVENVVPVTNGYDFDLVCRGKYPGKAKATLRSGPGTMSIRAKGSARVWGVPAGFSMKADATFSGACPADELERQRQKWAEEQAEKARQAG
jgi:hypothetical protein